jgi:hypothetical protein
LGYLMAVWYFNLCSIRCLMKTLKIILCEVLDYLDL